MKGNMLKGKLREYALSQEEIADKMGIIFSVSVLKGQSGQRLIFSVELNALTPALFFAAQ